MGGGHPKGEWVNSAITQQSLHKNLVFMRGKKIQKDWLQSVDLLDEERDAHFLLDGLDDGP
jgi:hypothetical protein